ncbi:MAG: LptF/LptG family permease [Methylacidiphilales bacterium]|nr:LptF/LptG family permease [Candidatus Methylacidiphilales bacterium]
MADLSGRQVRSVPAVTLIYNYLYKEIILLTCTVIGVLTFLLVGLELFKVIEQVLYADVPFWLTAKFVLLLIPFVLTLTIPTGLLAAVVIVFGRMSSDRELLALKASGIGLAPVAAPVVFLAIGLSLINYWLIAYVVPECRKDFNNMKHEILTNNPMNLFTPDTIIDKLPQTRVYFTRRVGPELENVFIWKLDEQNHLTTFVRAERAEVDLNYEYQQLVLTLFNERQEQFPNGDFSKMQSGGHADQFALTYPLSSFYDKMQRHLAWMTLPEITDVIIAMESAPTSEQASPYLTELQARISFSMSCFTFVLVGLPLAIQTQRRETSFGVVLTITIVGLYYLLGAVGRGLKANAGLYPELIIWAPNYIFQGIGAWLFYRANHK